MSRIINPDSVGKERKKLVRAIVISLRELMNQDQQSDTTRDLLAFIAMCLITIGDGIELTVAPWEKRDYWVKADRFRMDWEWTGKIGKELKAALEADEWANIPEYVGEIGQKFSKENVSLKHRMGTPWVNAWEKMENMN